MPRDLDLPMSPDARPTEELDVPGVDSVRPRPPSMESSPDDGDARSVGDARYVGDARSVLRVRRRLVRKRVMSNHKKMQCESQWYN